MPRWANRKRQEKSCKNFSIFVIRIRHPPNLQFRSRDFMQALVKKKKRWIGSKKRTNSVRLISYQLILILYLIDFEKSRGSFLFYERLDCNNLVILEL